MSYTHNRVAAYFGGYCLGTFRSKCDGYRILPRSKLALAAFVTVWQATAHKIPGTRPGKQKPRPNSR